MPPEATKSPQSYHTNLRLPLRSHLWGSIAAPGAFYAPTVLARIMMRCIWKGSVCFSSKSISNWI